MVIFLAVSLWMSWTHGNVPPYSNINQVHFRKHISKKLLLKIINFCPNLQKISVSKSASKRISEEMLVILSNFKIKIFVSENLGRPCSFRNLSCDNQLNLNIRK